MRRKHEFNQLGKRVELLPKKNSNNNFGNPITASMQSIYLQFDKHLNKNFKTQKLLRTNSNKLPKFFVQCFKKFRCIQSSVNE